MNIPKIKTMETRSGAIAKNQFIIVDKNNEYFQSYNTTIAKKDKNGKITLDAEKWDFSATTGVYRSQFLGEGISETRKKIKSGEYKLKNLNK